LRKSTSAAVVCVCVALAANGCGGQSNPGPLSAMVSPAIPATVQEIPNPLRGQYEDTLNPLFPQGNTAQKRYPGWPASDDASLRVSWRQLQPIDPHTLPADAPDDAKYDFSAIDDALTKLGNRNMRLVLGVYAYKSCCSDAYPDNTNIAIPDWMRFAATNYPGPSNGPTAGVAQVVPNWNDPGYLSAVAQLVAALGRRYDGDERVSVFEFSGYGDFNENQLPYVRDALGAAGPAPDGSQAALGYYSDSRDQSITIASVRQLVAANVNAFPHTQLVVTPQNPEIVRELLADDVTKKLSAPVGIRADCLGVQAPLPPWADSIVLKAMAKSPNDRYQSAAEMQADIQRAASGMQVAASMQPPTRIDYYEQQRTQQMGQQTMMGVAPTTVSPYQQTGYQTGYQQPYGYGNGGQDGGDAARPCAGAQPGRSAGNGCEHVRLLLFGSGRAFRPHQQVLPAGRGRGSGRVTPFRAAAADGVGLPTDARPGGRAISGLR